MTTPAPTLGPTAGPSPDDHDVVDLTRPVGPARFRLDPDVFEFARKVPIYRLAKLMGLQKSMTNFSETWDLEPMFAFFDLVMMPASAQKLRDRADDLENPIDHDDLLNAMNHMMEVWGMRPTQPSSDSSTTSDGGTPGTTSPDGPPAGASTLKTLLAADSVTSPTDTSS